MALEQDIMSAMKAAMKNKDKTALRGLRAVKSAILLEQTSGSDKEFDEASEIKLLQKLVKQRQDSYDIYMEQGREDLAQIEKEEIEVISKFLPAQLSDEELNSIIQKVIDETGASSMKDMGKVMGMATKAFAGQADMGLVSQIVREQLS